MSPWGWYAVVGAGAAAVVGVAFAVKSSSQTTPASPSIPSPTPTPLQNVSGGTTLTVSPTLTTQTVALAVQDPVVINLPTGGKWVSIDGSPIADTTSPYAFTFLGPINHTFVWTDANNAQYSSSFFFVLSPSATPQTTSA